MTTPPVTATLVDWIAGVTPDTIPEDVRHEGLRTFVNWLGCAVGGADHPTMDAALRAILPHGGQPVATVAGRRERTDILHAALLAGISSHVLDYDDTHLKTVIHPAGPVASALLPLAETRGIGGEAVLSAMIVGVEVACRIGNAIYPDHYDRGWHITGTCGVIGAAAAVGHAIGLDRERLGWAIGLATSQASGLREMFGTMTKSFHPGRAAQNGLFAALLAEAGYDSSSRAIEAPRGFAHVLSDKQDWSEILDGLGTRWEAALNSYKPFACGIVIHPTIDACQQLRAELGAARMAEVAAVELTAHPLVLELTGKPAPSTGLEGKFSVFHAAACALLRGDGGPSAFTDEVVNLPELVALRDRVAVRIDPACHEAAVTVRLRFADGTSAERHVERAIGSRERPLDRAQLDAKFLGQSAPILGEAAAERLLAMAWALPGTADLRPLAEALVPAG